MKAEECLEIATKSLRQALPQMLFDAREAERELLRKAYYKAMTRVHEAPGTGPVVQDMARKTLLTFIELLDIRSEQDRAALNASTET